VVVVWGRESDAMGRRVYWTVACLSGSVRCAVLLRLGRRASSRRGGTASERAQAERCGQIGFVGTAARDVRSGPLASAIALQSAHISQGHALTREASGRRPALTTDNIGPKARQSVWTCTASSTPIGTAATVSQPASQPSGPFPRCRATRPGATYSLHLAYSHSDRAKDGLISRGSSSFAPATLRQINAYSIHQSLVLQLPVLTPTS